MCGDNMYVLLCCDWCCWFELYPVYFHCVAHDTEHDRIVRGAALGVALCLYRKEDEADPVIDQMARDAVSN